MKLRPYSRYFLGLTRLFATVVKSLYYKLKALASLLVNYSIYYFRRTLLGQTDQQARKMDDATYAHREVVFHVVAQPVPCAQHLGDALH